MADEQAETKQAASADANLSTFFGVKAGMTRVFDKEGNHVPVTVVKLIPNVVSQVKTKNKEGYDAYQLAYFEKRENLLNNPQKGHLKKAGVKQALTRFAEVRVEGADENLLGKDVSYGEFAADSYVDVTGTSKGKGFQGVMKRHNFSGGPAAHGSKFHRTAGSVGMCNKPGKLFKLRKMPGHMGDKKITVQNIRLVELNADEGYALLKGSIPGAKNGVLRISKALKK